MTENRFAGIVVMEDEIAIWARNVDDRPLFRFNKVRQDFGTFRSKRMTEAEIEFCVSMFEKLIPEGSQGRKDKLENFLRFMHEGDVYCA